MHPISVLALTNNEVVGASCHWRLAEDGANTLLFGVAGDDGELGPRVDRIFGEPYLAEVQQRTCKLKKRRKSERKTITVQYKIQDARD